MARIPVAVSGSPRTEQEGQESMIHLTKHLRMALLVLAAFAATSPLSAATLTFESSATCTAGANTVSGSDSCLARNGFTFASASASAQPLAYGEVNLDVGVVMEGNGNSASISSRAGFEDFFIIYGKPDGTPAVLEMTADVYAGTDTVLQDAIQLAGMTFSVQPGFGGPMTLVVPFQFGDIMNFSVMFDLQAEAEDCEVGCPAVDSRSAGYMLQRFRVLDTVGREVTGFKFHTESETAYNFIGGTFQDPAAVPEPATYTLTGVGLFVAGVVSRRLRKS